MSFFRRKKEEGVTLIVDVANGSVGAALVGRDASGAPEIFYETRVPLAPHGESHKDAAKMVAEVVDALSRALLDVVKFGMLHLHFAGRRMLSVGEIVVGLSAPWHISKTSTIVLSHDKPFVVTERLIRDLLERAEEEFENEILPDVPRAELSKQVILIEKKITAMRVNGYETPAPYGKDAQELRAEIILSAVSRAFKEKVEYTIHRHFVAEKMGFHSFLPAAFFVLRAREKEMSDFVLATVGSEVTESLLVKQGEIVNTVSFPIGTDEFFRQARAGTIADTPSVAESFIKVWVEGKASSDLAARIQAVADAYGAVWMTHFKQALSHIGEVPLSSKEIYLFVPEVFAPVFTGFISNEADATVVPTNFSEKKGHLTLIDKDFFKSSFGNGGVKEIDPRLGMLGCFALQHVGGVAEK